MMKLVLKVAVSATLLTIVFLILPWDQVREALGRLPPLLWAGVLAGFLAGHALGVIKWRGFVNAGRASLRRVDAVICYSAGLFANLCLPSIVGGDVLRLGLAGRFTRRPEAALFGGIMDRVTDMMALTALATVGGVLARSHLPGWGARVVGTAIILGLVVAGLGAPLAIRRPLARWPARFRRPVGRALVALRQLRRNPAVALRGLTLSLIIQGSFVLLNALLGRGVGIDVSLAAWFLVWPLAKITSLLPISLGGLAVREASLAGLLLPFGVPAARSVVCSLLWQSVLIIGGLTGGLVWLVLGRIRQARVAAAIASHPAATLAK